jgi:hypothetical protein
VTISSLSVVNDVGVFATKHPYIVVVLTDGQTDSSRASTEIAAFSEKIFMLMEGR